MDTYQRLYRRVREIVLPNAGQQDVYDAILRLMAEEVDRLQGQVSRRRCPCEPGE